MSNNHSRIGLLLVNKYQLSLKSDPTLEAPNLLDPDQISLTYVSVMCTDRGIFLPILDGEIHKVDRLLTRLVGEWERA